MKSIRTMLRPLKQKLVSKGTWPFRNRNSLPEWEALSDSEFSHWAQQCVINYTIMRHLKQKPIFKEILFSKKTAPFSDRNSLPEWVTLSGSGFFHWAQQCVANNTIDDLVSEMICSRNSINKEYLKRFSLARKAIKKECNGKKHTETLRKLFYAHSLTEFAFEQSQDVFHLRFPVFQASSFGVSLIKRRRMRQIGKVPERWLTHSKEAGDHFACMLDVQKPKTTFHIKFKDIEPATDIVIKPCIGRGARGAYLVAEFDNILSLTKRIKLNSWKEMEENVSSELESGIIHSDDFIVQQIIYDDPEAKTPARDLKFYAFYGEVGLVLEVSRYPAVEYWWWSSEGKPYVTGKYTQPKSKGFGVTKEQIEIAKNISLEIPAPFMRIDFLKQHNQIYLAEFCSAPGKFEQFNEKTDRFLGDLYIKAEMRLFEDLNNGKQFEHIKAFNKEWEYRVKGMKQKS